MKFKLVTFANKNQPSLACFLVAGLFLFQGLQPAASQRKTDDELQQIRAALVSPSQKGIDVDTLTEQELQTAILQREGTKGYILKNGNGILIRTLFDTTGDGKLDQWDFYKDGVVVYRDMDTDGDQIADQMRWLNSGGTRWGVDTKKDGIIDYWKVISPEEVSEEIVQALASRDFSCFLRVALTSEDIKTLQCGQEMSQKLETLVKQQQQSFQDALQQLQLSDNSEWTQLCTQRPMTIPAGTNGSTKDMTFYDNPMMQVNDGEKENQVLLGTMIKIGDVWKVIGAPVPDNGDNKPSTISSHSQGDPEIPVEIQEIIVQIQELDEKLGTVSQAERNSIYDQIITLRLKVATIYANNRHDPVNRDIWLRDLADFINAAIVKDAYPTGLNKLQIISKGMIDSGNMEIAAYMQYYIVEATYFSAQNEPDPDHMVASANHISGMEKLVKDYPNTPTAAMVQLELVSEYEMANKLPEAKKAAQSVISAFPNTLMAKKATGLISRMDSLGKPFIFQGTSSTGATINVNQYNGKIVLLYFWASWADPTGEQATAMKRIQSRYERDGLSIIGVCLDDSTDTMQAYVTQNATKWPNVYEPGGQNSPPAINAGVGGNLLPFFILLDKDGKVNQNNLMEPDDVDRAVWVLIRGE